MFSRVEFEEGYAIIAMVAFAITAFAFGYFVWQAMRMKRDEADYMARRPLDSDAGSMSTTLPHE